MWPKSNHLAVFALDLKSTYEGKHIIIGLLSLANLAQEEPNILMFYFSCGQTKSRPNHVAQIP
jgi:hypothetical protein